MKPKTTLTLILTLLVSLTTYSQDNKVTLAFIGNISGEASANGKGGKNAFLMAVDERNQSGNLRYFYETVILDDHCDPKEGVQAASTAAINTEVVAGVTHYCSRVAINTIDIYHKYGLPVIVWGAVLKDITHDNYYEEVFRICGYQRDQNKRAAEFMVNNQEFRNWIIIYDESPYGRSHQDFFTEFLIENGGNIVRTYKVSPTQLDFKEIIGEIKRIEDNYEVIYFAGLSNQGAKLKNDLDANGINAVFQGTSGIIGQDFIDKIGAVNSEGIIAFREGKPPGKIPGSTSFITKYNSRGYSDPYDSYSAFPYVAANILIDAIEAVGPNRVKVKQYLKDHDYTKESHAIGQIHFDEHGQNDIPDDVTIFVVQNGKWEVWESSKYNNKKLSIELSK